MEDKYIYYEYDGRNLKVPVERQREFESRIPDAKMMLTYDGKNYKVPLSDVGRVLAKVGANNITYSAFDDKKEYSPSMSTRPFFDEYPAKGDVSAEDFAPAVEPIEPPMPSVGADMTAAMPTDEMTRRERRKARREERGPNWFETIGKSVGATATNLARNLVVDPLNELARGGAEVPNALGPGTGLAATIEAFTGKSVLDDDNPLENASRKMAETSSRLSQEADPSKGEGYGALFKKFRIDKVAQKALGDVIQSIPIQIAMRNPAALAIYGTGMLSSELADQRRENPDIPEWKRTAMAIGSVGLEIAVEKLADPLKSLFAKGSGNITQEMADDILQTAAREGSESIAKRIAKVLGKVGKDAVGEGGEELITSFGTDALGEALDAMDGDKDYGIRAQWENAREENPDITIEEFAMSKGKEYMEAFLGGALSSPYMSATAIGTQHVRNNKARKALDESRLRGSSMDYRDLYDVDDAVREDVNNAVNAFTDRDGNTSVSQEYIENLSANGALTIAMSENAEISSEQRTALYTLAMDKAQQEGLNKKFDDNVYGQIIAQEILVDATEENGQVTTGIYNGNAVYVMGGVANNGSVTLSNGENGPVMVIDAATGEQQSVRSEDIVSGETLNAEDYKNSLATGFMQNEARNRETARNTMSPRAKLKAIQPYAGKKIVVDVGNGLTEVLVQDISSNGTVIIKGKKGDLGGRSMLTLNADAFYDAIYRDDDGNPVVTDAPQEENTSAEQAPDSTGEAVATGDEDFRGGSYDILINGVPVSVDVVSQDNTSDSIVYEYVGEDGRVRSGSSTINGFKTAIAQAANYTSAEPAPTAEPQPSDIGLQVPQEVPVTPDTIDWDSLFEKDPDAYFAEMQKQFGEETLDILNEEIAAAQEELDSLSKKRGKTTNERLENRQKKVALQGRIDTLNGMIARLAPAAETIAETPVVPETTDAPVTETPATEPTATEAPAEVSPTEQPTIPSEPAPVETTPVAETPAVPESTEPAPVEQTPVAETPAETVAEPEPTAQPTSETTPAPEAAPTPAPVPMPSKPTAKGGAIARMIAESKKQIAKLAAKANIKDFTVDDNVRPVFGGVLRQGGYEYASDSHILAKIKTKYPAEQEGKIYSVKTGKEIKGRFPKADLVISGAESINTPIDANVDDILAAAQAAEELKKGIDKSKKIYVKVGRNHFDSSYLLKAARMAKQQGLTTITQHPTEKRAMLFSGENGVALIMPMTLGENPDVIDASTGEAMFASTGVAHGIKMPTTLKGIETARSTFEAVLPNLSQKEIDSLKDSEYIKLVDDKVVVSFWKSDIDNAKKKAKDPNTFAALEAIEKNGLEIPLSASEVAKLFPESVAPTAPITTESTPTAPKKVSNPIDEARKKERQLALNLTKVGLSPEAKQDLAFNAGKAIADMFATREEYDAYAENATDFGSYNFDFERGVEESFANLQRNVSNSPVNSVPLENEPNGENNGEAATEESGTGQSDSGSVRQTSDGGGQEANQGASEAEPSQGKNKSGSKTKQVASKYPVRKGNATQKLLKDTFGFESVTIPNSRKDTLNAIYDFMMEMSKMLGISPKSIGQGGTLGVGSLNARARATAEHSLRRNKFSLDFINASINFKYAKLEGIAHEWWHALDYALGYFDSSKVYGTTTEMSDRQFSGRKETYDAVQAVMQAIKDSGYPARIRSLTNSRASLKSTEMAARAFDGYLRDLFAAAGISIEGASYDYIDIDPSQQTPEEMAVIAPALANLFKVLQEKEGKTPGTSVLYHIGEMMAEDSPAKRLATDAVLTALDDYGIDVVRATDEQTQQMLDVMEEVAEMQKGKAPETASVQEEHHPTVVSSADGAKVIKDLDSAIQEYDEKSGASKTILGDIAKALGAKKHGSNSQYATFEAKNGKIFTIRLANHNARVSNFDSHNEDEGISIVIASAPNSGIDNDGRAHIVEFYYDSIKLRKAEGKPLVEILKSIKQALYSGEYKDNTGLAQVQEVNAPELMTVYHGSPSLFDEFDHSHMGEGEGAQAHGWGTYIAKSADTAKAYASMGKVSYTGPRQSYGSYEYEVVEDIVSIMNHGNSFDEAIQIGRRYWSNLKWEPSHRAKRAFLETLTPEDFKLRNLYEVEIPEDSGENYLDESNPIKKQVEKLYDACQKEGIEYADVIAGETLLDNRPSGKRITSNLSKMLGSPRAASEFLSRAGFVGIKYDGRRDGECFVIFNESDAKITGRTEFYLTPNGTVYGWTDGKKIYLTKAGINPNTPIHEYTHLWAKAMIQKNPKGWNSIKQLLKGTPVWNEVMNDPNYSNIHNDEDAVASEALSRISGSENAAKMEQMAQKMIDEAKGTARKLEARGLIQNMGDALSKFWNWVGTNLFGIEKFKSVEQITDRVLYDLLNNTNLGELSEGQVETQIVTDPKVIAELEASPKQTGYRNVVQNEDGTFSSPMAFWLQSTKGGAKTRIETAKFEIGKWEEAEEHPELVDDKGKVTLVKPNKSTVANVAYDPYIHNRLEPVNLQFKDAWKRNDLVYVQTEVAENDLNDGYHADKALLPVGVHSWSNGAVMLSRYDKPVRIMPWEDVADAWATRLNGEGVEFDVVPPALRSLLLERGVEILPPHKGMGKDCNDAYKEWKNGEPKNKSLHLQINELDYVQDNNIQRGVSDGDRESASSKGRHRRTDANDRKFHGIAEGYTGDTLRRAETTIARIRESLEKHRAEAQRFIAIYPEATTQINEFFDNLFYRNLGVVSLNADEFIADIKSFYGNSAQDLVDFIESIKNEQIDIREEEVNNALREIGIAQNEIVSYDTLKDIFYSFAPKQYESVLFDRLIDLAKRLDVKVMFTTSQKNSPIKVDGLYDAGQNFVAMDASLLTGLGVNNDIDLTNRIVHELLHSVTSKGFVLKQNYDLFIKSGQKALAQAIQLPPNIYDALETLESVYEVIKKDSAVTGSYGVENKKEMIAELSNPEFRKKLSDKGLWERVKGAIVKLLSYIKGESQTNTLSVIEDAVDKLLSELQTGSADHLYSLFIKSNSINGNQISFAKSHTIQKMDADYLAAVERGDMETAQRMVNEAAKRAMPNTKVVDENGNPKVVYHGSNAQFTEFDTARIGSTTGTADGRGFYFTTDKDYAEGFTTPEGQLFDVFLNIDSPLSYDRKTITKAQLRKILKEADRVEFEREGEHYMLSNYANYNDVGIDGAINEAANLEYDYADNDVELVGSLIGGSGSFELIMDAVRKVTGKSGMIAPKDNGTTHYVVTNPSAIKSASAVTYDDAGNVIPLSQRFNPLNPDIRYRGSENNSLSSQSYEGTGEYNTASDGRGEGVQEELPVLRPALLLGAGSVDREVSQADFIRFNPISKREGESDGQRNNRENKFLSFINGLTSEEQVNLYVFLKDYISSPSGILRGRATDFINSIRQKGNNSFADFVEDFINDELKYREGVSSAAVAKHGLLVGIDQNLSAIERMFYAFNNDDYNRVLFDRVLKLAKRFGVTVKFATRNADGSFISEYGSYNPNDNSITLDANLLVKGNEAELCQTILHELIHSVVARGASIMTGRAVDKNNQFIDPQSLPKDVVDGINTLKEVYEAIKDDGTFQDTYGKKDFEEMLSEITDPKFRGLLKAKKLWKKFLNGICKILGIADESSSETDALTEIESALDKILSAAERGELDSAYASYLGRLAEGYTLEDLQRLGDGPVKTMLAQNILFRTGIDPDTASRETAKAVYDRVVTSMWQETQRQFQDAMQPVRVAIDAIQQETGNTPIEDYENYLLIQNQTSSRSRNQIETFKGRYYDPIVEQVNLIIDELMDSRGLNVKDEKRRSQVYKEVIKYLIAKHGLERNKYYQTHKTRRLTFWEMKPELDQAEQDYNYKVNQINADTSLTDAERQLQLRDAKDEYDAVVQEIKTREIPDIRDYSGLTTLFATDDFQEAERQAQEYVDNLEALVDTTQLWDKINAATDKTLRHSYESGLISRQQYNDIKSMFNFYIPLRGFDETTAEDVYAYARFEGNRFNPAVAKTKGRKSLADGPIAMIMNMAESEIAQGNKNRAKQALYNFLLNRTITDGRGNQRQNSLMQIQDVWYVKSVDASGNVTYQIAAPNHAAGETYEDFENRMLTLEAAGNAMKSKKGQVDVGMRFQKVQNQNAHYVYLKVNGVEKAIYINGNPKAAEAINGTDKPKPSEAGEAMRAVNRFISSTFTNYSLEFTARNYFRDMLYSHINVAVNESDPAYRKTFRKNWRKNNMRTTLKLLKAYRAGELEGRVLTDVEAAFVQFMENGGQTGYTLINSVETHKKDLERAIERMRKGIEKGGIKDSTVFKYTLGGIELLNETSELVTRFAAFKTSRDMGRSVVKSISDAKEVTVNFNTKGAQDGKGALGIIARYLGGAKFFFNASVQGVQNVAAMARANKLKFGTVVGGFAAFGFMMPLIQGALISLLGGDDEDEYWNIPEYDRQNNICIVLGNGKYAKMPLPIGFREVYAIGDMLAAMAFDKKFSRDVMQVGMDMANKISSIILPVNPLEGAANGLAFWQSFLNTVSPSSAQFAIQNAYNTDWKGAPLQKEYSWNIHDPQWMKAFASNPDWMTGLSKWCNENIDINDDMKGMDWSPERLDNTLSNLGGGIYSLIKKTGRSISMIWNEEERNLSNVPLAGVVFGSGIDSDDRFVTDAYYEMKDYYEDRINRIETRAKSFGYTLEDVFSKKIGAHHPKMQEVYGNKEFDFMQKWYMGNKELEKAHNAVKKIEREINRTKEPSIGMQEELVKKNAEFEDKRRKLVNELLELE